MTTKKVQVTGEELSASDQKPGDVALLPESDKAALVENQGEEALATEDEDEIVEVFLPVYDANDIVQPGYGRTVKVRKSTIDAFKQEQTERGALGGMTMRKFVPTADQIVHE